MNRLPWLAQHFCRMQVDGFADGKQAKTVFARQPRHHVIFYGKQFDSPMSSSPIQMQDRATIVFLADAVPIAHGDCTTCL